MKRRLLVAALALVTAAVTHMHGRSVVAAALAPDCNALTLTWDGERNQELRLRT